VSVLAKADSRSFIWHSFHIFDVCSRVRWHLSAAGICLSVCLVSALTFKRNELELHFWYVFRISRSSSYIKVMGSRSTSLEQKTGYDRINKYTCSRVVRLRLKGNLILIYSTCVR